MKLPICSIVPSYPTPMTTSEAFLPGVVEARRRRLIQTTGYYLAFITLGLISASLGPTLPGLTEQTRSNFSQISYLFTARSFGYLVGSFSVGRLYDRFVGNRVMAAALAVIGLCMFMVPRMAWLPALILLVFIIGFSQSSVDVGGNTLILWVHGAAVGPFMNGLHFFWGVGAFLAPIIVAWAISQSGGIALAYVGLALLVIPPIVWLLRVPSPDRPLQRAAADTPNAGAPAGLVMTFMAFVFLYVGAEVSFGGWIYTYALTLGLADAETAAYLTSAFWGALTFGRLLSIPLAARFRPAALLGGGLLGALMAFSALLIWRNSSVVVWAGTIAAGLSMAGIFPVTITLANTLMTMTGRITGWFFVGSSAGGMIVPWLIGQRFETVGAQVTMMVIFADMALAGVVYLILLARARTRRRDMLQPQP
jgi:FHS family Na+ dependent glucose MFS transporter 1